MRATALDLLALGLRLGASGNAASMPADVFESDEIRRMFDGKDGAQKITQLREFLKSHGVDWIGGPVIDSVRGELETRKKRREAEATLRKAMDSIKYRHILGVDHSTAVVEALGKVVQ